MGLEVGIAIGLEDGSTLGCGAEWNWNEASMGGSWRDGYMGTLRSEFGFGCRSKAGLWYWALTMDLPWAAMLDRHWDESWVWKVDWR